MSDTENAPAPAAVDETLAPVSQADATAQEGAAEAETAPETVADAPEQAEPATAPLESPEDGNSEAAQDQESAQEPAPAPETEPLPLQTHEFTEAQLAAQAADVAEQEGAPKPGKTDTLLLQLDAESLAKLTAELSAQITAGFAAAEQMGAERAAELRREFQDELNEFAGHFEKKLESIAQGLDGLDPEKLAELLAALKDSGVAELKARLDKLELQLRHTL